MIAAFYLFYELTRPVFAYMWGLYCILNDLWDIYSGVVEIQEEKQRLWTNILKQRKDF